MTRKILFAAEALFLLGGVFVLQACFGPRYAPGYGRYGYAPGPAYTHAQPYVAPPPAYLYGDYDAHHVYHDRDWWVRNDRSWVQRHHPDWLASSEHHEHQEHQGHQEHHGSRDHD